MNRLVGKEPEVTGFEKFFEAFNEVPVKRLAKVNNARRCALKTKRRKIMRVFRDVTDKIKGFRR
jgi:hypothetical protein